ncbi:MAG: hypothetical protein AAFO69_21220 [Bacteroidota bacterium]
MIEVDRQYFEKLKSELSNQLRSSHPAIPTNITQWKSKEIALFQDDLLTKVNGRISEKWFYTHIKSEHTTLPRIDILDLLSQYVGTENWVGFRALHADDHDESGQKLYVWQGIAAIMILILFFFYQDVPKYGFEFCFIDTYSKIAVTDKSVDVILLDKEQSPRILKANPAGCLKIQSPLPDIRFVIRSPYYVRDTVYRRYNAIYPNESIELKPNDYARIIHLFSNGNVAEWNDRKRDLERMFHDNAKIYQVFGHSNRALAIFNKDEFIRKLILPTGTLRNLEILETVYEGDQISLLRFKKGQDEK